MYVKISGRFFYLIIFIDEYSKYIAHHSLITSMDADLASLEAHRSIEKLRRDSVAEPVTQSDNGSLSFALEFKMVLKQNNFTQKLIPPHTPEQNGIVERVNKTMRETLLPVVLTDYEHASSEISRIVEHYNNERRHSSLNYLIPKQYYKGEPYVLLAVREAKIEKAGVLRREKNMIKRKGCETT